MKAPACVSVAILIMAFLAMGATDPEHQRDDFRQLMDRVSSLERRVQTLESRLQSIVEKTKPPRTRPANPPRDHSRPNGRRRREFNGVPYYVIPVEQESTRSTSRRR